MNLNNEIVDGIKSLPTLADRFDAIADLFEKNQKDRVLDVFNTRIDKGVNKHHPNLCYACIAGHLADIASDGTIKSDEHVFGLGSDLLNEMLFHDKTGWLEEWAYENPNVWGNERGDYALLSPVAYGFEDHNDDLFFEDIISHFRYVASNLRELNKEI